jgi:hypothetical protein
VQQQQQQLELPHCCWYCGTYLAAQVNCCSALPPGSCKRRTTPPVPPLFYKAPRPPKKQSESLHSGSQDTFHTPPARWASSAAHQGAVALLTHPCWDVCSAMPAMIAHDSSMHNTASLGLGTYQDTHALVLTKRAHTHPQPATHHTARPTPLPHEPLAPSSTPDPVTWHRWRQRLAAPRPPLPCASCGLAAAVPSPHAAHQLLLLLLLLPDFAAPGQRNTQPSSRTGSANALPVHCN